MAGSPVRLPRTSVQPLITCWLVTTWPLALTTNPVPDLLTGLGFADPGAPGGASPVTIGFATAGLLKSPALLIPSAFTLVTQLAQQQPQRCGVAWSGG